MYNEQLFAQNFEGKINNVYYIWVVLIPYLYKCFLYLCLSVKSVNLENNNNTRMQNYTLEYDNQFCF